MYTNGAISIINNGDGSGTYQGPDVLIQIGGDGSGTYTDRTTSNDNHGDGSATYASGNVSIINRGDGTGVYSDGTITIENLGDGTALVNGLEVEAEPLAPVPALGVFPVLDAIDTADLCGVTVTLDAAVLFDYDKATIRPEAEPVLENLATALNDLGVASAVVEGHTDAHGSDAYNQTLSEQRAEAVVQTLEADGATAGLTAVGYGESRPVAPNTMPDGADNPAGRQLNRRVEVFVPAL
ncbi:MAG: OmpA family protein [Bifidobacteriaceae bacterium]|nr:OmpA family protein [Bifidobacteriaceae bacterium]